MSKKVHIYMSAMSTLVLFGAGSELEGIELSADELEKLNCRRLSDRIDAHLSQQQ